MLAHGKVREVVPCWANHNPHAWGRGFASDFVFMPHRQAALSCTNAFAEVELTVVGVEA